MDLLWCNSTWFIQCCLPQGVLAPKLASIPVNASLQNAPQVFDWVWAWKINRPSFIPSPEMQQMFSRFGDIFQLFWIFFNVDLPFARSGVITDFPELVKSDLRPIIARLWCMIHVPLTEMIPVLKKKHYFFT